VGTAPKEAVSYYIQDWPPESDFYYDAGFQAGVEANSPTPQDVVIILDFNKPAIYEAGPIQIWGTRVLDSYDFMNFDAIMGSSVEFAEGFVAGANGSGARLWLGVGTNNFQKDALRELTVDEYRSHGANWAYLVEPISSSLKERVTSSSIGATVVTALLGLKVIETAAKVQVIFCTITAVATGVIQNVEGVLLRTTQC
jgi:hypothetical protein